MGMSPRIVKASALVLSGAALGGAGGYAASASGASAGNGTHAKQAGTGAHGREARLRRAISITAVVAAGEGKFATVTVQRGILTSVSGSTVTLREGTRKATYKTVTLTLPADTRVRLARKPSSLSALSAGDRIAVVQGPHRSVVAARPPASGNAAANPSTEAPGSS